MAGFKYGNGFTAFIDDFLCDYRELRNLGNEHEKRNTIAKLFAEGGIEPRLRLLDDNDRDLGATEITFFKKADIRYACLLRDYQLEDLNAKKVRVQLPYRAHVYEVGRNECHGFTDSIRTHILPGRGRVFALSPHKIDKVKIQLDRQSLNQGETLSYTISSANPSLDKLPQALRLTLINSDGEQPEYYTCNLLPEAARLNGHLRLALNEKKGQWKIQIQDVVSGQNTQISFEIR